MNEHPNISGIVAYGGTVNVTSSAIGDHAVVNLPSPTPELRAGERRSGERWDVGVIAILSVEMQAVIRTLGLRRVPVGGLHFYEGSARTRESPLKVVAVQSLEQGQRSAMAAYGNLRRHYDPKVIVLTGVGGGKHPAVRLGDVVVATRAVYYDLRKETPDGTRHRGEERHAPAEIGHAVNAFFTEHDPAELPVEGPDRITRTMRMLHGPIGSGDAVIADRDAEILTYLDKFNDKILAVDMEAAAIAQACHEQSAATGRLHGWVVVRGISDDAGAGKNDDHHPIASWHAAVALDKLLPYLHVGSDYR